MYSAQKYRFALFIAIFFLISVQIFIRHIQAVVSSCSSSVSPGSVAINSTTDLTFTLNNTSSQTVVWVKFGVPSSDFSIQSGSSSGWSSSAGSPTIVTFTGGSIPASSSQSFTVRVSTGGTTVAAAEWTVRVSDSSLGDSPTNCSGSNSVEITGGGGGGDTTAPTISDITVSDVTSTSVKITWTTNEDADSVVEYGLTSSYGSSKTDTNRATSHSITVDGLSANATYHYRVKSADSAGNTTQSSDNTFVSAKQGETITTPAPATNTITVIITTPSSTAPAPTPTPTPVPDTTSPTISIKTDFSKAFTDIPLISGSVSDNKEVGRVQYSLDNGQNWLSVDSLKGKGTPQAGFSFKPAISEDGNFKVRVRSFDSSGNVGYSSVKTLIIDRLPPSVGGAIFSIGPQLLTPNKQAAMLALEGLDQKITISAVGGPTGIDIVSGDSPLPSVFSLVKNPDSGLWSGTLAYHSPGEYKMVVKSVDGAGNKTEKTLGSILVLPAGQVLDQAGKEVKNAKLTLYYFEPVTGQFVIWDGRPFGQKNPQQADENGKYRLFVPPGKYYLQVEASFFKGQKTTIFAYGQALPVNASFKLSHARGFKIGSFFINLPEIDSIKVNVKAFLPSLSGEHKGLEGQQMPFFAFPGSDMTTFSFRGKPTIFSFMSSWSPFSADQLNILEDLTKNQQALGVGVIMIQESVSKTGIFKQRGEYQSQILADPDGKLLGELGIFTQPTHLFVDRKGIIKRVRSGILGYDEIIDDLLD